MQQQDYDVIVVGAGTAGLTAAARIAERGIHPRTGDRLRVRSGNRCQEPEEPPGLVPYRGLDGG